MVFFLYKIRSGTLSFQLRIFNFGWSKTIYKAISNKDLTNKSAFKTPSSSFKLNLSYSRS